MVDPFVMSATVIALYVRIPTFFSQPDMYLPEKVLSTPAPCVDPILCYRREHKHPPLPVSRPTKRTIVIPGYAPTLPIPAWLPVQQDFNRKMIPTRY